MKLTNISLRKGVHAVGANPGFPSLPRVVPTLGLVPRVVPVRAGRCGGLRRRASGQAADAGRRTVRFAGWGQDPMNREDGQGSAAQFMTGHHQAEHGGYSQAPGTTPRVLDRPHAPVFEEGEGVGVAGGAPLTRPTEVSRQVGYAVAVVDEPHASVGHGAHGRDRHAASAFIGAHLRASALPLPLSIHTDLGQDPMNRETGAVAVSGRPGAGKRHPRKKHGRTPCTCQGRRVFTRRWQNPMYLSARGAHGNSGHLGLAFTLDPSFVDAVHGMHG